MRRSRAAGVGRGGDGRGVLIVVANLERLGGLQTAIRRLGAGLAELGPVTLVTWAERSWNHVVLDGGRVLVVSVPSLLDWDREWPSWVAAVNTAVSTLAAAAVALSLRRRWSAVLAAGLDPEGLVAAAVGRGLGRRFVLSTWLSGPRGNVARLRRSALVPGIVWILRAAAGLMAETDEVAEELVACGFDPARVHVVPHGVDTERFVATAPGCRPAARRRMEIEAAGVASYCGRFDLAQKRLDILLAAWKRSGLRDWCLVLCGDGPDRAEVERLATLPGPKVRVLGWQADVRRVLAASDAFVMPTEVETTCLAVAEAMACGVPVLASAIPAFERLRPDGLVTVINQPGAWAAALAALAGDQRRREELGRQARAWACRHRDERRTVAAYSEVLGLAADRP